MKSDGSFPIPEPLTALEQTGERMTAGLGGQVEIEHYHRYCVARDLATDRDVLDVAAGEGYGAAILSTVARSVTGVELDESSVMHAQRAYVRPNLTFLQGDALAMPVPDSSVDLVVSFETLEHFADHEAFLLEIRRVLRPNGILLISTPDRVIYSARGEPVNVYHVRELTQHEFVSLLQNHFSHHNIYFQRSVVGSILSSTFAQEPWRNYEKRGSFIEVTNGLTRAPYLIGLASDAELPTISASTYVESDEVDHILRAAERYPGLERKIAECSTRADRALVAIATLRVAQEAATDRLRREVESAAAKLAQQAALLREMRARADEAIFRLHSIETSGTWRATAPIRAILTRMPRTRRFSRRLAKALWWSVTLQLRHRMAERKRVLRSLTVKPEAPLPCLLTSELVIQSLPPSPPPREDPVDIVVCVHNAVDDVRCCLTSIKQHTLPPYRIFLVDDGSGLETCDFLRDFAYHHNATLLRHETARGYTFAANAGLRAGNAPMVVLLNSDTEVTDGWLDRMADLLHRHSKVGIVGPLSNAASWQSVPRVLNGDDWAQNDLPAGVTLDDLTWAVANGACRLGIEVGFLNGFCLLIRRRVLDDVGLFDEKTFGAGYGEENDLCIRARRAGWTLMVAEDAFVLHHQSKSYGHDRRRQLVRRADAQLAAKHDHARDIGPFVHRARNSLRLEHARQRVEGNLRRRRLIDEGRTSFQGRRIGVLLPIAEAGGGANVILQEAQAARAFGVDTWIMNTTEHKDAFCRSYPDLDLPVLFAPHSGFAEFVTDTTAQLGLDAVVATAFSSFAYLPRKRQGLCLGYYIQDLETLFFEPGSAEHVEARRTYFDRPEVRRFTKSRWNATAVGGLCHLTPTIVGPSVQLSRFAPAFDQSDDARTAVQVTAMVRPSTPRRNPGTTLQVLRSLNDAFGDRVSVSFFGATPEQCASIGINMDGMLCHGALEPRHVARLLGNTHVFLDFSTWQAMGLSALEAMASGAAVLVPHEGGATEFCENGTNALVINTSDIDACLNAAGSLVEDAELRLTLRLAGLRTAYRFPPERAALEVLRVLFAP
jgi:GT2 family glycosyltransferase/ubiquinone/menaquinone biosynthesis C-methylase UbiE